MSYDSDFVQRNGLDDALDQVRDIVVETLAYIRQMMTAPPLLAEGLSGDYRLLAEFNHIVLAGHEREGNYGVVSYLIQSIIQSVPLHKVRIVAHAAVHIDIAEPMGILFNGQQTRTHVAERDMGP